MKRILYALLGRCATVRRVPLALSVWEETQCIRTRRPHYLHIGPNGETWSSQ